MSENEGTVVQVLLHLYWERKVVILQKIIVLLDIGDMKFKLCLTLFLITLAVTCLVIIIIVVPIVVLPSLSDKKVDFNPVPVTCQLRDIVRIQDWKKCRVWHSCRQDCRRQQIGTCSRLYVAYYNAKDDSVFVNGTTQSSKVENGTMWIETFIPLRINPDSCGEWPEVDCDYFHSRFEIGQEFPCYHSRTHPPVAVMQYTWRDEIYPMFLSITLLTSLSVIFCISCLILCFWHCRGSPGYDQDKVNIETVRKYAFE